MVTTGCGEHLTRVLFAKQCAELIVAHELRRGAGAQQCASSDAVNDAEGSPLSAPLEAMFRTHFLEAPQLRDVDRKVAGVLCARLLGRDADAGTGTDAAAIGGAAAGGGGGGGGGGGRVVEALWAHTSASFALGFLSSGMQSPAEPIAFLSRHQDASGAPVANEHPLVGRSARLGTVTLPL